MAQRSGVLGIFIHLDATVQGIRDLRSAGFRDLTIHAPIPHHEIGEVLEERVSPIRIFTLIGGIVGCISGFALTIGTSLAWPLITGGKPIVSIPPFLIIAFELTILMAALGTLLGFLVNARLPRISLRLGYDGRFTDDRFGILVSCPQEKMEVAQGILQSSGAEEVRLEQG